MFVRPIFFAELPVSFVMMFCVLLYSDGMVCSRRILIVNCEGGHLRIGQTRSICMWSR